VKGRKIMMKINNKKQMIITSIVCVLPMIIGAIIYSKLPKQMPIHFNYSGNADNYAPKAFVCFALPLIMLLANLLLHVIINNDPKNNGGGSVVATISKWTIPVVSVIVFALCSIYGLGYNLSSTKYVIVAVGILIIFIGNYLPKCRQNYTVGIKLPWTLNDINNWNKTHRMAGVLWIICGILFAVSAFLGRVGEVSIIILIIVMVCVPTAYSFLLYKNKRHK
jgi:uncharacterized membrane protein